MPEFDPVEAAKAIFFLVAAAVAIYAPAMYMLQSRHHGIDDHERRLQKEYEELEKDFKNSERRKNLLDQITVVQIRYNGALLAFIFVMLQQLIFLGALAITAVELVRFPAYKAFTHNFWFWALFLFLLPGMLGFFIHIFVDLRLAFRTQKINRKWLIKQHHAETDCVTSTQNTSLRGSTKEVEDRL